MELGDRLIVYIVVLFAVILILFRYGLKLSASIIVAMVVAQVVLLFLQPPYDVDSEMETKSIYALYSLIMIVTIVTMYAYSLVSAFDEYRPSPGYTHYSPPPSYSTCSTNKCLLK